MKISKMIGVSVMTMLLATLMVSAASAAGNSYGSAEFITVPDGDIKVFGPYSSAQEEWWQFSAAVGDRIYIDLDETFTENGGKEYLHDEWEGDIQAWIVSATDPSLNNNDAVLDQNHPHIEINRGSSSYYQHLVSRNNL